MSTTRLLPRAANSAASFTRLARSAPEKAGRAARDDRGVDIVRHRYLAHMHLEYLLAAADVRQRHIHLAVETAGRSNAGSSTSGRLVAAMMITPSLPSKPSISTSNWLRVCSRSSCPPPRPAPALAADCVDSSMKMMHGACFFACSNMSRTARGTDADEHLDEIRTGDREERHLGLAGDRLGEQRLAGTRAAGHEHTLGDVATELLELGRVAQEFDQFADFFLASSTPATSSKWSCSVPR